MSRHQWGRSDGAGRLPSASPLYSLAVLPLALVAGLAFAAYQYQVEFTTLQRWYLGAYLKSTYAPRTWKPTGQYRLVDDAGDRYVARPARRYSHAAIEPWLRDTVYEGQTAARLALLPAAVAGIVLAIGLCVALPLDRRNAQRLREGVILRGGARPRSVAAFNAEHRRNDGIRIRVQS